MSDAIITCNLPGRLLPAKRFCPHMEMGNGTLIEYTKCESCPFRTEENTITVQLEVPKLIDDVPKQEILPTLTEQVGNLAKTLINVAKETIVTGKVLESKTEAQRKLEICHECEFFIKDQNRCGKCGCFLALKTRLNGGNCPIGKW